MNKYDYTDFERQLNAVLVHQQKELSSIVFPSVDGVNKRISESEAILASLGYGKELEALKKGVRPAAEEESRKVMVVPSWEKLCLEAEREVGNDHALEDLFTSEELKNNEEAIKKLNDEYNALYRLDAFDVTISVGAGLLGAAIDILLVGIPKKTPDGLKGGPLSNYVRRWFDKRFPEEEMEKLANSKVSKVPYDAQDNRNTKINVEGLSAYYHRLLSLGHDPLLGFLIGVANIMTGKMTTIDKRGKIVTQTIEGYADRKETSIFVAIGKQFAHFKSDVTTSMGLPAPLMGLFSLLQFGSIGEEKQTIAEIVQGMYYEGYDFIHFCSLSIPVMVTEVAVRLGYAIKQVKQGRPLKECIPLSVNGKKPKLDAMLFLAYASSAAVNAGKVYFTKNPMAINYPQWIAFGKYSYQQLKRAIITNPMCRNAYVKGILYAELRDVFDSVNKTFDEMSKDYIVVFE